MICKLLGHKLLPIHFPRKEPDSIISLCLRCGKWSIIRKEDTNYIFEEVEDEEEEVLPVPPDNHFDGVDVA